jgi:hypothetical protein
MKIALEDFPQMRFSENDGLGFKLQLMSQMGNAFG